MLWFGSNKGRARKVIKLVITLGLALVFMVVSVIARSEFYGELGFEYQYFFDAPQFQGQGDDASSVTIEPTWSHTSKDGKNLYDVKVFARYDENDSERTRADIRELSWVHTNGDWEFRSGIRKVFWGVAETQHLVDIINQTDAVERFDGEVKLGQPMINISKRTQLGDVDFFLLPYFRERTFPGIEGRLRPNSMIDTDNPVYESSSGKSHLDYAVRWSHSQGVWDFGISYFDGTGREPVFRQSEGSNRVTPNYVLIRQLGLDIQATVDSWLYKLETINRKASAQFPEQDFSAFVLGVEKTFFDLSRSGADLGVLYEQSDNGSASKSDDTTHFIGLRLALNDEQSTSLLLGCDTDATTCLLEGSRRVSDNFKLSVRANTFSDLDLDLDSGILFLDRDSYVQANLSYFF